MRVDLRSDTVTSPSPGMREAMARAEVGDDVFREDPTVKALEERCAAIAGTEAGLFVPSGTMANQIALQLHARPGDEVLLAPRTHCVECESGGMAVISGAQPHLIGSDGLFGPEDFEAAIRPRTDYYPRTALVWFENSTFFTGRVFPLAVMEAVAERARSRGIARHLDGARLFNAAISAGVEVADFARCVDSLSFCFSKGLGAPVGSMLLGSASAMAEARFLRRRLGGAMRQAGILAAAANYALDHNLPRLAEDHQKARELAIGLAEFPEVVLDPASVETNLVRIELAPHAPEAGRLADRLRDEGVLVIAMGPRVIRAVTHLDVPADAIPNVVQAFAAALQV